APRYPLASAKSRTALDCNMLTRTRTREQLGLDGNEYTSQLLGRLGIELEDFDSGAIPSEEHLLATVSSTSEKFSSRLSWEHIPQHMCVGPECTTEPADVLSCCATYVPTEDHFCTGTSPAFDRLNGILTFPPEGDNATFATIEDLGGRVVGVPKIETDFPSEDAARYACDVLSADGVLDPTIVCDGYQLVQEKSLFEAGSHEGQHWTLLFGQQVNSAKEWNDIGTELLGAATTASPLANRILRPEDYRLGDYTAPSDRVVLCLNVTALLTGEMHVDQDTIFSASNSSSFNDSNSTTTSAINTVSTSSAPATSNATSSGSSS
ncbi:unnamed protein product, partial [Amoebophrya sp. A25]